MKTFHRLFFIVMLVAATKLFTACTGNASFSSEEIRFFKPFVRADTAIYQSDSGQTDTIIFQAVRIDTIKYRNFEQGFYNENMLRVAYELSPKSFHQFTVGSTDGTPTYFINFIRAKNSHSAKEICFLGLIFDEDYLDNIAADKGKSILFSKEKAKYSGVNINEGIQSFEFSFDKGVVSFVDRQDREWVRAK
jgi:hypothetical protein